MNSEPFHSLSQDWTYSSKDKTLVQSLRLGQLPQGVIGESVIIAFPTGTDGSNGFNIRPSGINVPDLTPYAGVSWDGTTGYIPTPHLQFTVGGGGGGVQFSERDQEVGYAGYGTTENAFTSLHPGGLRFIQGRFAFAFSVPFGLTPPQAMTSHLFTSEYPPPIPNPPTVWPPAGFAIRQTADIVGVGVGIGWQTDPLFRTATWLNPQATTKLLIDNLATGTAAGISAEPGYPAGADLDNFNPSMITVRFGDTNP